MQPILSASRRSIEALNIAQSERDRRPHTVALCTLINMIDGFDILAISFTAPAIAKEWQLSPEALGLLFSSGLAGMTFGALFLSSMADWRGRKPGLLFGLGLITLAMGCSALSVGIITLIAARFVTGAGVGAIMPTINTITAESGFLRRDLAVSIQGAGFPLGGFLGGLIALTITGANWQWIYSSGAALSLLLLTAAMWGLPEQPLVPGPAREVSGGKGHAGFQRGLMSLINARASFSSGLICACFFLLMFTFYFLTNWTPTLLTRLGLSAEVGISGSIMMNAGGIVGDIAFILLLLRWSAPRVGGAFLALCFGTVVLFAFAPLNSFALLPIALFMGFLLFGSMLSLYAIVPVVYPARTRAGGTGFALGIGRIGAVIGPYAGGILIGANWTRASFLLAMAFPLLACAVLLRLLSRRLRHAQRQPVRPPARPEQTVRLSA